MNPKRFISSILFYFKYSSEFCRRKLVEAGKLEENSEKTAFITISIWLRISFMAPEIVETQLFIVSPQDFWDFEVLYSFFLYFAAISEIFSEFYCFPLKPSRLFHLLRNVYVFVGF